MPVMQSSRQHGEYYDSRLWEIPGDDEVALKKRVSVPGRTVTSTSLKWCKDSKWRLSNKIVMTHAEASKFLGVSIIDLEEWVSDKLVKSSVAKRKAKESLNRRPRRGIQILNAGDCLNREATQDYEQLEIHPDDRNRF